MTREDAETFAATWADAWNARDVEAVLAHFQDDVVFVSPTALAVVGSSTVRGKAALRAYWTAALERIGSLRFTVERVLWDPVRRELAIVYTSAIDGRARKVSENLTFDEAGRVVAAEVFHGAESQMTYTVTAQRVAARHVAAVRERRRWADLGPKLLALLDRVYVAVRAGRVIQTGQNIFIFRDRSPDAVTVEIGVEVSGPFEKVGDVVPVTTPSGEVASTVHTGPYAGLGAAHAAVIDWCTQHGRARADVWWEIYGDWHDDPARLETEVVYALAPEATA